MPSNPASSAARTSAMSALGGCCSCEAWYPIIAPTYPTDGQDTLTARHTPRPAPSSNSLQSFPSPGSNCDKFPGPDHTAPNSLHYLPPPGNNCDMFGGGVTWGRPWLSATGRWPPV